MISAAPSKKQTLLHYLSRGVAMVHIDARRPGVHVPRQFIGDAHLRLNLSYRYGIPDLVVDDEGGVQATLSFGGSPFRCQMPWSSIFGITSHESGDGQVWPEDLPTEVQQTLGDDGRPHSVPQPKARIRPELVSIEESRDSLDESLDIIPPPASPRLAEPPPELRRVKKNEPPEGPPPRHLRLVR